MVIEAIQSAICEQHQIQFNVQNFYSSNFRFETSTNVVLEIGLYCKQVAFFNVAQKLHNIIVPCVITIGMR